MWVNINQIRFRYRSCAQQTNFYETFGSRHILALERKHFETQEGFMTHSCAFD